MTEQPLFSDKFFVTAWNHFINKFSCCTVFTGVIKIYRNWHKKPPMIAKSIYKSIIQQTNIKKQYTPRSNLGCTFSIMLTKINFHFFEELLFKTAFWFSKSKKSFAIFSLSAFVTRSVRQKQCLSSHCNRYRFENHCWQNAKYSQNAPLLSSHLEKSWFILAIYPIQNCIAKIQSVALCVTALFA